MRRLASAATVVLLAGCRGVQSSLDAAGDHAAIIAGVWTLMMWVCGTMGLLLLAFLAWALLRARRRRGAASDPQRHDIGLARGLHGWIALIVVGLFVLGIGSFLADRRLTAAPAGDVLHVRVTGMQWWWQVEYPGESPSTTVTTANELHLPVGRTADIELRTQDVIHSLWIPNLNGKQDLIPGRVNHLRVTPRRVGRLRGQCAEFCGLQHAWMALDVQVEEPAAFEAWRRHQLQPAPAPSSPAAGDGARVFNDHACVMCHAIAGSDAYARSGPDLTHLASRRTLAAGALPFSRGALAAWLIDPQRVKPGAHMPAVPLTPVQREHLVDYLMTLE
jgi:cytochrome c oxidase subunit 2